MNISANITQKLIHHENFIVEVYTQNRINEIIIALKEEGDGFYNSFIKDRLMEDLKEEGVAYIHFFGEASYVIMDYASAERENTLIIKDSTFIKVKGV